MNPEILYHGSPKNIEGELIPQQANCEDPHPENNLCAVYATDNRLRAIFRAIDKKRKLENGNWGDFNDEQRVYLYSLPADSFERTSDPSQFISRVSVMPIRKEVIDLSYHLHLLQNQ